MKKLSKRLISVVLAVLLIVTSIPLFAFNAAAAAGESGVVSLKAAIDAYTSKMNGTVYNNMYQAYEDYIAAYKLYDQAKYGSNSVSDAQLNAAQSALEKSTENMTEWAQYSAPNPEIVYIKAVGDEYRKGIIYNTAPALIGGTTVEGFIFKMAFPRRAVLLYDGSDIRVPVMMASHNNGGAAGNDRAAMSLYTNNNASSSKTDNDYFQVGEAWRGRLNVKKSGGPAIENFNWNSAWDGSTSSTTLPGYNATTNNATSADNRGEKQKTNNGNVWWEYSSYLVYKGASKEWSNGLQTATFGWTGRSMRWTTSWTTSINDYHYYTDSGTYYVIEYLSAINAINAKSSYLNMSGKYYLNGELSTLLKAFDKCTIDPTAGYTSDNYASHAAEIAGTLSEGAAELGGITSAPADPTAAYQTLRDAEDYKLNEERFTERTGNYDAKGIFAAKNEDSYWSDDSWAEFNTQMTSAQNIFDAVSGGYTNSNGAAALAQPVIDAYKALEIGGTLVDPAVEAFEALRAKLADYKYMAADLRAINTAISDFEFYKEAKGTKVDKKYFDNIANEESVIKGLAASLTAVENFDKGAFDTYLEDANRKAGDPDAYNVDAVTAAITQMKNEAFETVTIAGTNYIGLAENAQELVDNAEAKVMEGYLSYTVTVNGKDAEITDASGKTYKSGTDKIPYGTVITVSTGSKASYTYDYVSYSSNKESSHHQKFVGTLEEFTFTVVGDTSITAAAPTDSSTVKVTYKSTCKDAQGKELLGYTVYVEYVASGTAVDATKVKAPGYAFYSFQKYSQTNPTVTANTVIYLEYAPAGDAQQFEIYRQDTETTETKYYGETFTVTMEDAVIIATAASQEDAENFYNLDNYDVDPFLTLLAYGNTYTFTVTRDLYLVDIWGNGDEACLYQQKDTNGEVSPVAVNTADPQISGGAIMTHSSFAMPEDCTFVEAGILIQYNKSGAALLDRELSFDNAGAANDKGNDKIRRYKSTQMDKGTDNCFSARLNLNSGKSRYVAYVNYKDADGELHTVFSEIKDANID